MVVWREKNCLVEEERSMWREGDFEGEFIGFLDFGVGVRWVDVVGVFF